MNREMHNATTYEDDLYADIDNKRPPPSSPPAISVSHCDGVDEPPVHSTAVGRFAVGDVEGGAIHLDDDPANIGGGTTTSSDPILLPPNKFVPTSSTTTTRDLRHSDAHNMTRSSTAGFRGDYTTTGYAATTNNTTRHGHHSDLEGAAITPAKLKDECIREFLRNVNQKFGDGSIGQTHRTRAAALGATTTAASPATSGAEKGGLPSATSVPVVQRFTFPWMRLTKLLWQDALEDIVRSSTTTSSSSYHNNKTYRSEWESEDNDVAANNATLQFSSDFSDLDALHQTLEVAIKELAANTQAYISALTLRVNHEYAPEATHLANDCVALACLRDVLSDRVLPRLRASLLVLEGESEEQESKRDAAADPTPASTPATSPLDKLLVGAPYDVRRGLFAMLDALEELCASWVASFAPWITHLTRQSRLPRVALFRAERGGLYTKELKQELVATIRQHASKRYREADLSESHTHARAAVFPLSWLSSLEAWLVNPNESQQPPPINTWKLVVLDSPTADWILQPRKVSELDTSDCEIGAVPEPLFNVLWELFGAGPKLIVPNQSCDLAMSRLSALSVTTYRVMVEVGDVARQRLSDALTPPPVLQQLPSDPQLNDASLEALKFVRPMPIDLPFFTSIADAVTHCASSLVGTMDDNDNNSNPSSSADDLNIARKSLLRKCLMYGHYDFDIRIKQTTTGGTTEQETNSFVGSSSGGGSATQFYLRDTLQNAVHLNREAAARRGASYKSSQLDNEETERNPENNKDEVQQGSPSHGALITVVIRDLHMYAPSSGQSQQGGGADNSYHNNKEDTTQYRHYYGVRGLDNIGNTCYMNSGLQCLSNLPRFRQTMLQLAATWKAPATAIPLTFEFVQLLRNLWRASDVSLVQANSSYNSHHSYSVVRRDTAVTPREFKYLMGLQSHRFAGSEQQDAIDMIELLLDRMHDELNPVAGKKFRARKDEDAAIAVPILSKLFWDDHMENNTSPIANLFYIQERTRFECMTCSHKATVFDVLLSLPVPVDEEKFISVDVAVFLNPLDVYTMKPSSSITASSASTALNEEEEEKPQRPPTLAHPSSMQEISSDATNADSITADRIERLIIRVRVPAGSSLTVVAAEVRRVLSEAEYVSAAEAQKSVHLFRYHAYNQIPTFTAVGQTASSPLSPSDRLVAVIIPSSTATAALIKSVTDARSAAAAAASVPKDGATTSPPPPPVAPPPRSVGFGGHSHHHSSSSSASLDFSTSSTRVMFFLRRKGRRSDTTTHHSFGSTTASHRFSTTASTMDPQQQQDLEKDNAAYLDPVLFSVLPGTTTRAQIWAMARRVVQRYTYTTTSNRGASHPFPPVSTAAVVATAPPPDEHEEGTVFHQVVEEEGSSVVDTSGLNNSDQQTLPSHTPTTQVAEPEETTTTFATSWVPRFQVVVCLYPTSKPTPLADDDQLAFTSDAFYDHVAIRVIVELLEDDEEEQPPTSSSEGHTADASPLAAIRLRPHLPALEHETLQTVISNEAAEEQRRKDGALTLQKALANMIETHVLKGDNAWYCPACKEHRESITEPAPFILPEILTIHLKRFKSTSYGSVSKVNATVKFPLLLDMAPYMADDHPSHRSSIGRQNTSSTPLGGGSSSSTSPQLQQPQLSPLGHSITEATAASSSSTEVLSQECLTNVAIRNGTLYELVGVVYHSGTLSYGHYTAQCFCEGAESWVYYDDSRATLTSQPPSPENAYILYYQRVQPGQPRRPMRYFGEAQGPSPAGTTTTTTRVDYFDDPM